MKLTQHFTLEEMTRSATAQRRKIKNTPGNDEIAHLKALCEKILEPIREAWGAPVVVTCGYRSPLLNKIAGGSKTSEHMGGYAADIRTLSDSPEDNKKLMKMILGMKNLPFRQIINEYPDKNGAPNWIHISYNPSHPKQKSILTCINGKYYRGINV